MVQAYWGRVRPRVGEQGAESIRARFNSLQRTYHCMRNKVQRLLVMVKEHNLSIAPQNVAASPSGLAHPAKRTKHVIVPL